MEYYRERTATIDEIKKNIDDHVYFLCILDDKGEEILTKILSPIC